MAKIFRTEKLSVNGDNIRLASSASDEFEFTQSDGTVIMSRATISSDVSSLQTVDTELDSDVSSLHADSPVELHSDVSSLHTIDEELQSDVSSLYTIDEEFHSDVSSLNTIDEEFQSDVSSLNTIDKELDSDVSSLAAKISTNDVQVSSTALSTDDTSATITFDTEFDTSPTVVGSLRSSDAADPIIGLQIEGAVATATVKFVFSDEIPSNNYTLEMLASV